MANSKPHVYFSDKMLKARYKDPRDQKYHDYVHTKAMGKDQKPLKMYRIFLPSANHRELQFQPDENGIDRNSRKAYIQVPRDAVYNTKFRRRKVMFMNYPTSTWTVYFESERLRDSNNRPIFTPDGKHQFDKPKPIKIGVKEMMKVFDTSLVKKKDREEKVQTSGNKTTQKELTKEKEINKQKEHKPKQKVNSEREL